VCAGRCQGTASRRYRRLHSWFQLQSSIFSTAKAERELHSAVSWRHLVFYTVIKLQFFADIFYISRFLCSLLKSVLQFQSRHKSHTHHCYVISFGAGNTVAHCSHLYSETLEWFWNLICILNLGMNCTPIFKTVVLPLLGSPCKKKIIHVWLCKLYGTIVILVHNTAQDSFDNLPSYLPEYNHSHISGRQMLSRCLLDGTEFTIRWRLNILQHIWTTVY